MRIVILGAGTVGVQIARELIEEKRDVVLIEKNSEIARMADNQLDCLVINEDGSRPETLRKAQAGKADWFLALTGSDAVNIVACGLVASESPGTRTIARVETPFYSTLSEVQRKTFGLDILINPAMEAARALTRIIDEGFAEHVIPLHEGALQMRMVDATHLHGYAGKTLGEIRQSSQKHFLVAAVVRGGAIIVPKGDCRIYETDRLYVLGQPASLDELLGPVAGIDDVARRILILGASRIAERLIECLVERRTVRSRGVEALVHHLLRRKMDITLIDSSESDCKRLAQLFQEITINRGDCAEEGVLESSGVTRADLFIGATDSQSKNIITAQLAKVLGAKKSIAMTINHRFLPVGPTLAVDSYLCANDAVVATVLETVRKAHIRTIHAFYEDTVEIVELVVDATSPVNGQNLREIELPREVLVAFVQKSGEFIVPTGETVLSGGDQIGLVTPKNSIAVLEQIFGGSDGK